MTFWIILVVLCLLAIVFAGWPLWRESHKLTPLLATVIVFTVAVSVGLYDHIGSPGVSSGQGGSSDDLPGMEEVIGTLEARLAGSPDDVDGWKMLARTHMSMRNYAGAADALEKAMELEGGQVAQTMVDLALAILSRDNTPIEGRTRSLIDSALALEPNNQAALFYSGVAAANRGDTDTAAGYWETLLALNPPEDVRGLLEQRIAQWRGEIPSGDSVAAQPVVPEDAAVASDAIISVRVAMSNETMAAMTGDANIFVIARDPAAPSPPIAVSRLRVSELPTVVDMDDAMSMVAGRELSAFREVEVIARISLSGGPAAASGDWFGSTIIRPADNNSVSITIDQQVP